MVAEVATSIYMRRKACSEKGTRRLELFWSANSPVTRRTGKNVLSSGPPASFSIVHSQMLESTVTKYTSPMQSNISNLRSAGSGGFTKNQVMRKYKRAIPGSKQKL